MIEKIPTEFYDLTNAYAVTISPDNQHQHFNCKVNRLKQFKQSWNDKLSIYNNGTDYVFNIEISQHGRLHLHGVLKFNHYDQIKNHYLNAIHMLESISKLEIKKITSISNWRNYCDKQQHIIRICPISNLYNDWDGIIEVISPVGDDGVEDSEVLLQRVEKGRETSLRRRGTSQTYVEGKCKRSVDDQPFFPSHPTTSNGLFDMDEF